MRQLYSLEFIEFWALYPRRVNKQAAWRAWLKIADRPSLDMLIESLDWQREQPGWREDGGKWIPYPSSWLNGRRWEDEPCDVAPSRPASLGPVYHGWECPHEPACHARHYCALKSARE